MSVHSNILGTEFSEEETLIDVKGPRAIQRRGDDIMVGRAVNTEIIQMLREMQGKI